ncbi:MAG: hypothetical protein GY820_33990 [Gammaproteobacteria bacterium]|nr:hypothetical protein [Gammaproteobacteria bacterium]
MSEINTVLLGDFIDESRDHLGEMESLLLKLVKDLSNVDLLNDIFRMIHNVKGAAQITGLDKVSRLSHRLEDLLDLLRQGQMEVTTDTISLLITGCDRIVELVSELAQSSQELSSVDELIDQVDCLMGVGESIEELDDKELFDIYLAQLREQFTLLSSAALQFKQTTVDVGQLGSCQDAVIKLASSATYMGYRDIVELLEQWLEDLYIASASVSSGERPVLDFMDSNLSVLKRRFPQLVENSESLPATEPENHSENASNMDDDITSSVLNMFNEFEDEDSAVEETPDVAGGKIESPLLSDFIDESRENLEEMELLLIRFSTEEDAPAILDEIFRTMHNIKGAAQLTGLDKTSRLAHRLEDLLDLLRQQELNADEAIVGLLITGRDRVVALINELEQSQQEISSIDDLVEQLTTVISGADSLPSTKLPSFDEENDQDLYDIFTAHLSEQLALVSSHVKQFQDSPDQRARLESSIKNISSLQSSANYMGYQELSDYYQQWIDDIRKTIQLVAQGELVSLDIMDAYIDELVRVFPQINQVSVETGADVTRHESDLFDRMTSALDSSLQQTSSSEHETLIEVFDELVSVRHNGQPISENQPTAMSGSGAVGAIKQGGQQVEVSQRVTDRKQRGRHKRDEVSEKRVRKSVRVDAEKIDILMNQVGELVVDRSYFFQLFNEMRELQTRLKEKAGIGQKEVKLIRAFTYRLGEAISGLGRTSSELQEGVMKMRMLPVSHLFNRYPRLVHDLTSKLDKKVSLVLRGEETELDRMIVEELSDPLIHIIRNSVDHGIESPDERQGVGKPEEGKLTLDAFQESNHIIIQVTDDGRGLDPQKIKQKAVNSGLYTSDEVDRLNDHEIFNLILMPGFSTAEKITGTSGRGVGMDVVKKNIERLNGTLDIDSKTGKGTQMRLKIPLTLAIIHALMVRVGDDMFTIPLANVDETVRISRGDTSLVEGVEVIYLRGVALPVFRLSNLFKVSSDVTLEKSFVVIVNTDGQRIGFVVDELLGQDEVVIKPLEDYVQEKSGFSGATVVGDGRISLILDVYELVKVTTRRQNLRQKKQAEILRQAKPRLVQNPSA